MSAKLATSGATFGGWQSQILVPRTLHAAWCQLSASCVLVNLSSHSHCIDLCLARRLGRSQALLERMQGDEGNAAESGTYSYDTA
jgi:hypothetical protein